MKVISLHQPWASLIADGYKQHETRHWSTNYRGVLLIHAAKRPVDESGELLAHVIKRSAVDGKLFMTETMTGYRAEDYPLGCIVASCYLADCIPMTKEFITQQTEVEKTVGWWEPGRFAWKLDQIQKCEPIPVKGRQGLWDAPLEVEQAIAQVRRVAQCN